MENTLAQEAYFALRDRLRSGTLPPGARLVNRRLAAELGISFTPVREAISRLVSEGLAEHHPGAGAFVRRTDRREIAQLYDLRITLECYAVAEAARHISTVELEELRRACDRFGELVGHIREDERTTASATQGERTTASASQGEAWLRAEERFHELLIRAARNPWLTKVAVELRLLSLVFGAHAFVRGLVTAEVAEQTWQDHARVLEMLAVRDAEAARDWMEEHIRRGRSHVLARVAERETERSW